MAIFPRSLFDLSGLFLGDRKGDFTGEMSLLVFFGASSGAVIIVFKGESVRSGESARFLFMGEIRRRERERERETRT